MPSPSVATLPHGGDITIVVSLLHGGRLELAPDAMLSAYRHTTFSLLHICICVRSVCFLSFTLCLLCLLLSSSNSMTCYNARSACSSSLFVAFHALSQTASKRFTIQNSFTAESEVQLVAYERGRVQDAELSERGLTATQRGTMLIWSRCLQLQPARPASS